MPHRVDTYDTDPFYLGNNERDVVSGRRIASFFGLADPNIEGKETLDSAQQTVKRIPRLLEQALLCSFSPDEELKPEHSDAIFRLDEYAPALSEWLCGTTTRKCAELAGQDVARFEHWVYFDARKLIGSRTVYEVISGNSLVSA